MNFDYNPLFDPFIKYFDLESEIIAVEYEGKEIEFSLNKNFHTDFLTLDSERLLTGIKLTIKFDRVPNPMIDINGEFDGGFGYLGRLKELRGKRLILALTEDIEEE